MRLTIVDDARYTCELGEFYKIFAQNDHSWEFKAKGILDESELVEALKALRSLKRGETP